MKRIAEQNLNTPDYWDKFNNDAYLAADKRRGKIKFDTVIANIPDNSDVMDVGCLGGNFRDYLIEKKVPVKKFYGLDFAPKSIEYGKKKHPNDTWLLSSCYNISLPDNSLDVVVAMEILEHIEYPVKFLREAYRILKHDGLLLVTTPNQNSFKDPSHVWDYDIDRMTNMVKSSIPDTMKSDILEVTVLEPGRRYIFVKLKIKK